MIFSCCSLYDAGFNPHRPFRAGATSSSPFYAYSLGGFNPHRPFRAGATARVTPRPGGVTVFQSSPALSGRCNVEFSGMPNLSIQGFNPHRPFRAGATGSTCHESPPRKCFNPHRPFRAGATSVDTWHEGGKLAFQSSPALSGRCNPCSPPQTPAIRCFNPHRPFRAGATWLSNYNRPQTRPCFNPHRPFRAGATVGHEVMA